MGLCVLHTFPYTHIFFRSLKVVFGFTVRLCRQNSTVLSTHTHCLVIEALGEKCNRNLTTYSEVCWRFLQLESLVSQHLHFSSHV